MSDNTRGGSNDAALPLIATDDVSGVQFQRIKLDVGADGATDPVVGSLPVSDGGGSLTVDGSVSLSGAVDTELTTADLDTGAGTDTRAVIGIVGSKSGGAQLIPGDATAGLKVDLGADNDVTITSGTVSTITNVVHVDDNASTISVDDGAGTLTVDNGGTFAVQESGAALTSLQLIDDVVHASDAALGKVAAIGAQFDDTSPGTTTENNVRPLRMSTRREMYVQIRDAAGNERGLNVDASGQVAITVASIPSHAVTNAGTFVTQENGAALTSLQLIDDAVYGDDAARSKSLLMGAVLDDAGTTAITENQAGYLRMSSRRALLVEGVASGTVIPVSDGAGSLTVDGTVTASNTAGDIAHDGVNSGNPVQLGVEAIAHGTNPSAVAAADRTKLYANRAGIPFVMGGHPNIITVKHTTITTAVTDAAIITVSAGSKIIVTSIAATLDNASTVFPTLLLGFGAVNTPTTTGVILAHGGVPAGGGIARGDGSGILGIGADGEDLRVTTTGNATGNGLQIVVSYYTVDS
jgi:hypothetical protein